MYLLHNIKLHVSITEDHHETSSRNFSQVQTFLGGWTEVVHAFLL